MIRLDDLRRAIKDGQIAFSAKEVGTLVDAVNGARNALTKILAEGTARAHVTARAALDELKTRVA